MTCYTSEVKHPFGVLAATYSQRLSTECTDALLLQLTSTLLDRLSEEGWASGAGWFLRDCTHRGDVPGLCLYDPDVLDLTADDQRIVYQISAFFRKRDDIDIGVDRKDTAFAKFREAESDCAVTNSLFRAWARGGFQFRPRTESILHAAQQKIAKVLGDAPSLSDIRPRFGPGATTQVPKKNACVVVKMTSVPACSTNQTITSELLSSVGLVPDGQEVLVPVHRSKLQFVPKTAKTDRAICTEPSLNGMFQNGLGDLMARRLRTVGIDIRDQGPNQRAALYGSISGALATLDLSSASDTIAHHLVEHLFPLDWCHLFSELRSGHMVAPSGEVFNLEKVSSMGNGFTFPLETLIFWAVADSCSDATREKGKVRRRTLVYGDDIVVPVEAAELTMAVLFDLGFTLNRKKSFWSGSFRESCGCDYVFGTSVRPVFVSSALTGGDIFRLHNFFRRSGDHVIADLLESVLDETIRIYGPDGYGDGHLIGGPILYRQSNSAVKNGYGGVTFDTFTFSVKRLRGAIARDLIAKDKYHPRIWDDKSKRWGSKVAQEGIIYAKQHYFTVKTLALYTQYLRESNPITLTKSDELRSRGQHCYADRRMPNPVTRQDHDYLVVPGEGAVKRTRVYIFEPLAA